MWLAPTESISHIQVQYENTGMKINSGKSHNSLRLHQSYLYWDSLVFDFEHFYLCNLLASLFSAECHYFQEHYRFHIPDNDMWRSPRLEYIIFRIE